MIDFVFLPDELTVLHTYHVSLYLVCISYINKIEMFYQSRLY